jgi:hypothetical protein
VSLSAFQIGADMEDIVGAGLITLEKMQALFYKGKSSIGGP